MTSAADFLRETSYRALPREFFVAVPPLPSPSPQWVVFNDSLAAMLGLPPDAATPELLAWLSGGPAPHGRENIALAYSGHQFGHWNPLLGDGRAAIAGEIVAPGGEIYDVHLKGTGPTPFAQRGDGRATLSAMLREYVVSEAMAGLDIPTTRALAVAATGTQVSRERIQPGAVLTRVARSHIRIGTFQYAAAVDGKLRDGPRLTRALADHCIERLYPDITSGRDRYIAFYAAVVARQAHLVAQWMLVGFIHGVMNTDNMSIAGETIDFGPCAFMDSYNRQQVFSSIDTSGRYAFERQAPMAMWNLARLAEALLPLFDKEEASALRRAHEMLEGFQSAYVAALDQGLERKLGLRPRDPGNEALVARMWRLLEASKVDFTSFFCSLTRFASGGNGAALIELVAGEHSETREEAALLLAHWRTLISGDDFPARLATMRASNPIVIARNHRVEQALDAANEGDLAPLQRLCAALRMPYAEPPRPARPEDDLKNPPKREERVAVTFCGT